MGARLTVSVVVYRTPSAILDATLDSLARAVGTARQQGKVAVVHLAVVNNADDTGACQDLWSLLARPAYRVFHQIMLYGGQGNVGYGKGHNRILVHSPGDYHLVLNPDVLLAPTALAEALGFMEAHPGAGLLAPRVDGQDGQRQYLCKRYPSVLGLLLRAFAPVRLRRRFTALLHHYEMRDLLDTDGIIWDVPIVSGCFMLFRVSVVRQLGGFSSRFFLYFEDFDLSLRTARISRSVYLPTVCIVHLGGQAARKGWRHIGWFGHSMVRFFNRHGWRWC